MTEPDNDITVTIQSPAHSTTWHPKTQGHCLIVGDERDERKAVLTQIAETCRAAGWSVQRGNSIEKQQEIITDIWVLMEMRYAEIEADPAARAYHEPILLLVDEYDALPTSTATQVRDLLALARSAKINVVVASPTEHIDLMTAEVRDNFAVRIPPAVPLSF